MGMNYYAVTDRCPTCAHPKHKWHICKNFSTFRAWSYGGPFDLQVNEFSHWEEILARPEVLVVDEFNDLIDKDLFLDICRREGPRQGDTMTFSMYERGHKRDVRNFVFYNGEFS